MIPLLVVDDSSTVRAIVSEVARPLGFQITEAADGYEAWQILKKTPKFFSLVIADINMPRMNGIELVREIRSETATKDLPVCILTADTSISTMQELKALSVDVYLVKPINENSLRTVLHHFSPKQP